MSWRLSGALNRLELIGETMRAVLNELARVVPDWLQDVVSMTWYERYGRRIEDSRLPWGPKRQPGKAGRVVGGCRS